MRLHSIRLQNYRGIVDATVDFADDRARGPVRPSVAYESRRPARAARVVDRRPDEGTILAGAEPVRRLGTAARVALIAGGALLGREIAGRGDRTLGTILGGAAGALIGREVGKSTCRR